MRTHSIIDQIILQSHQVLKTLAGETHASRPNPANQEHETLHAEKERKLAARLMRINHVGEVCAQALYQGQALTAKNKTIQEKLRTAAKEENDHLAWCKERIGELDGRVSWLNPLWYVGSLAIGAMAGLAGDKINLGFLAETERQVEQHLSHHLQKLPAHDIKSRKILMQMRDEEIQHAHTAENEGAAALPPLIHFLMRVTSKIMTITAYWI